MDGLIMRRAEPNETASSNGSISLNQNDPVFKTVGLVLAITSGKLNKLKQMNSVVRNERIVLNF